MAATAGSRSRETSSAALRWPRAGPLKKIFLCYRREDSADVAGRIFDHLERRFGRDRLFIDVDSIPYGEDFRRRVDAALNQTGVLLAVIGDGWLTATDRSRPGSGRRIDDPHDYVATEIAAALSSGVTVLPVLVGQAHMPTPSELPGHLLDLSYRNAAEVRSGRDFTTHVTRLIDAIADIIVSSAPDDRRSSTTPTIPRLPISVAKLAQNPNSLVGSRLAAFVVERSLAIGGSGIAYIGRNPRTGQRVCIKVSLPVLSDMEAIRRTVARGIRGLVALDHPHVVRVHEFDGLELADARSFYVVMDLIEGPHFDVWANGLTRDRDGQRAFLRAAYLIARALEAAHTCRYFDDAGFETTGVLHGDVKPGNIAMRADGTPALMDFMLVDIHRALDPQTREQFDTIGAATAVFGTPGFMAPEQMNEGIVTVRTDVYGLGATLRAAAGDLALPTEIAALIGRMTGQIQDRPRDMNEVARAIAGIAQRHGMESAEMTKDQTSPYPVVSSRFRLRLVAGPDAGMAFALGAARMTVGRAPHNDVVLREQSLSRSHFGLNWSVEEATFFLVEFGARERVTVNGRPVEGTAPLAEGDVIAVGSTEILFERGPD